MAKLLSTVLFVCIAFDATSQIIVYNQRYQVENMPQPKSFSGYSAFSVPEERLITAVEDYRYNRSYYRITGNPIPIKNKEGLNISVGFGYATDRLNVNSTLIQSKNQSLWTQLYTTGSIGENYYWRGVYAFGSYSENLKLNNTAIYKHTAFLQMGRKWNSNFATGIGLLALSNFDDYQFIPVAHISYSKSSWVIDAFLPNEISIRYIKNDNLHFLIINNIIRRSYYNIDDELAYKYSLNEAGFQSEIRIKGVLWAELSITKPYALKMQLQSKSTYTEIGDVSEILSVNAGLFIRFQQEYGD